MEFFKEKNVRSPSPTNTPWSKRDQEKLLADLAKVTKSFTIAQYGSDGYITFEERIEGVDVHRIDESIEYLQGTMVYFKKIGHEQLCEGKITCVFDHKPEGILGYIDAQRITYDANSQLGRGGFGKVFEGTFINDQGQRRICAVKRIYAASNLENRSLTARDREAFLREWQLAKRRAMCPNVLRPWGYFICRDEVLSLHCTLFCLQRSLIPLVQTTKQGLFRDGQDGCFIDNDIEGVVVSPA